VGLPVDSSLNCTTRGEHPDVLLAEKAAFTWALVGVANNVTPARASTNIINWFFIGLMINGELDKLL
jgi:hypothetical protein